VYDPCARPATPSREKVIFWPDQCPRHRTQILTQGIPPPRGHPKLPKTETRV